MERAEKAAAFRALHIPGNPLVLFNIWDAGSAQAVAKAGAKALATGSWSVAAAHGFGDKEQLPLELAFANAARIVRAVDLPVSLDFEGGYAREPAALEENIRRLGETGIVGVNFEDGIVQGRGLYDIDEQETRIAAIRRADSDLFINARTDLFLLNPVERHAEFLNDAIERAQRYAAVGGDGFFVPGLTDEALIARLCRGSPLPVNIMAVPGAPPHSALAAAGAARISHGAGPYRLVMKVLAEQMHMLAAR